MSRITFGTDGWRAVISREFTFDNVRYVAAAAAEYFRREGKGKPATLGYDRRFLSREYAHEVAGVATAKGLKIILSQDVCPTPSLSLETFKRRTAGGIIITASHNTGEYNGIKIRGAFGGPVNPDVTRQIEGRANALLERGKLPQVLTIEEARKARLLEFFDPRKRYLETICSLVDVARIKQHRPRVVVDAMYGAGVGVLAPLLSSWGLEVREIHGETNPSFGGLHPEPIGKNLGPLCEAVRDSEADVGLALDGDADRVGVVDERGHYLTTQDVFALLLMHVHEDLKMTGEVVKTCSSTSMLDKLCEMYGLVLHEVPVGFKWVCDLMLERDVLIGGEESGGYGIKGHIPERDGSMAALYILQMLAIRRQPLSQILNELYRKVGYHAFRREDFHLTPQRMSEVLDKLRSKPPKTIAGRPVDRLLTIDGFKFSLRDGSWILLRPSGTEPLFRVYVEGASDEAVEEILTKARRQLLR
jgi:alpha-D-glucose phosphate-specific phosphoglucomutase